MEITNILNLKTHGIAAKKEEDVYEAVENLRRGRVRLEDLRCRRCGRKLEVGEEVWRHLTRKDTRYYCKGCYKKL